MKSFVKTVLIIGVLAHFFLPGSASAQNQAPIFSNVKAMVDTVSHTLSVTFDLLDPEEDTISVQFRASNNGGQTYVVNTSNVTGDAGPRVAVGKGRTIKWKYAEKNSKVGTYKIKLVADDGFKMDIARILGEVDTARLLKRVTSLYGVRNHVSPAGLKKLETVKNYIEQSFSDSRINNYRRNFEYAQHKGQNIIATIPGTSDEADTYIVCAHFDTAKDSPGGDDNATGVAGMLEAARILSRYNFKNSVKFIGFDMEELGMRGSKDYVFKGGIKEHEMIRGVLNLDMIGSYSDKPKSQVVPEEFQIVFPEVYKAVADDDFRGNFLVNTGDEDSGDFGKSFVECSRKYLPGLKLVSLIAYARGEPMPALASSDHAPFWYANYPALHLGDGGASRNQSMNGPNDTMRGINYQFMGNVVKASMAAIMEWAQLEHSTVVYVDLTSTQ
jgi:hypothetical protein